MDILRTVLSIIFAIDCVALVVVVLMQEGKDRGLGAIAGGSSSTETYWSKNKGRSREGKLKRITCALAVLFVVLAVVLNVPF